MVAGGFPVPAVVPAPPKPVTCPGGHTLAAYVTPQAGYTCDDCHATMPASFPMEGCRTCNFDLCQKCLGARRTIQQIAGRCCPNGHTLKPFTTSHANFFCDGCRAPFPLGATTAGCRACDYDLCLPVCCSGGGSSLSRTLPMPVIGVPIVAGLREVQAALDAVAGKAGFKCVPVSWEDAQRGTTAGGGLSSWGANISDVRLYEKSGKQLYTLRSQNWNERVGYVASKDVAVVVGNHAVGGAAPTLQTLQSYLTQAGTFGGYAGVRTPSLFNGAVDHIFTIRFQTVFLPVASTEAVEFCTEVYNYNTRDDSDPRNLLLLCTAQGTSVQQDGRAAQRVYHHEVDGAGRVHRYWLEAERSSHAVGGAQVESAEEVAAAAARGKSTAIRIGTRAMGTRFNVQMMVQVPLEQRPKPQPRTRGGFSGGRGGYGGGGWAVPCSAPSAAASAPCYLDCTEDESFCEQAAAPPSFATSAAAKCKTSAFSGLGSLFGGRRSSSLATPVGTSNAARVSRGSERDVWSGVASTNPQRDGRQHGTITVTLYYTVAGGVPSAADVQLAIDDLNTLYSQCATEKRLVDCHEVMAPLPGYGVPVYPQPYMPGPKPFTGAMAFPQ